MSKQTQSNLEPDSEGKPVNQKHLTAYAIAAVSGGALAFILLSSHITQEREQQTRNYLSTLEEMGPNQKVSIPFGQIACLRPYIDRGGRSGTLNDEAKIGYTNDVRAATMPDGTKVRVDCSQYIPN